MSVLAVVSKAVFEKEARSSGRLVGPGDVWSTALYASQNPGLESLASGGALFLATVRPGDVLWLVGVLESPTKSQLGWSAAPNTAPVRDISALMPKLRFATGKGITAEPGKLGMSLQTPRQLTANDEALLRGATASTASPSTATPPPVATATTLAWKLDGYRRRSVTAELTAKERALLDPVIGLLEQNDDDEAGLELADVIDTASRELVALVALWPVEAGTVIDAASGEEIAAVYELYFDAHGDDGLRARMKAAFEAATFRFDDPPREFTGNRDTPKPTPPASVAAASDDPRLLAEILELRAELDANQGQKGDPRETMGRIGALQARVLGEALRPYPVRRPFELTEAQRAWLELVVDHYAWRLDLTHWGLPWKAAEHEERAPGSSGSPLSRMIGRKPPLALDTTVELDGKPHPLWAIFKDAVVGLRPERVFLDAIGTQPVALRERAFRQLARGEDRLGALYPRDKQELQRGWAEPKDAKAATARYQAMVRALFDGLGDRGEHVALAALDEPDSNDALERGASLGLRVAALDGLARRAKARGSVLDATYDTRIAEIVTGDKSGEWLLPLFAELPRERAGELTGIATFLVQEFPSASGLERIVAEIVRSQESGKGSYAKLAAQLAAKFPEAAQAILRDAKPKLTRFPDALDKALEAAEKAIAKGAKKSPKKKG